MKPEISVICAVLTIVGITHFLGGITAYGSTLMAFPALVWVLDFETTRTVLLVVGTLQAYLVFASTRRHTDWRELGKMFVLAGVGLPIGVLAATCLPQIPLFVLLGVVLIGSGSYRLRYPTDGARWPRPVLIALLLVGGIIHGAFVCGGSALVLYLQNAVPEKDRFRGTLSAFWSFVNTILIMVMLVQHGLSEPAGILLLGAVPLVIGLSWIANRIARRLSQAFFARLVAALLIGAGVVTIAKVLS